MARIAVGGFQHETNTFAPSKAGFADFITPGAWPGLTRGRAMFEAVAGINIPIAGFIAAARGAGHELRPLAWAAATPSAHVTREAYERIAAMLLEDLAAERGIDGVYLDLHGAMVAEHLDDGEGELLRRVRELIGPDRPLVASLDLHANITPAMMALADRLIAYRTYPHVDMAATGGRAARALEALLTGAEGGDRAFRQLPFLIPLTSGCTLQGPAKALYARLAALERGAVTSLSFACGFPPADIRDCGPSLVAYGRTRAAAEEAAEALLAEALAREGGFTAELWSAEAAVEHALARARDGVRRPVVLADAQDNPGGGGNADTTDLLKALVDQKAEDATLAILCDRAAAEAAHAAGEGAEIHLALGGTSGPPGQTPLEGCFRVARLGDGVFTGSGPFYRGARMQLGPMALLTHGGVGVIVGGRKLQAADQAIFRHLGVEPHRQAILALKSSVHFRADFQPIADEVLIVAAPGPCVLDNRQLAYRKLRPGVRLMPLGPAFAG